MPQAVENALMENNYIPSLIGFENLPDLPKEACDEDGEASRRRALQPSSQALVAPSAPKQSAEPAADAWLASWRERLACWFVALPGPTRLQLGNCMGALGLHVGSRLEALVNGGASADSSEASGSRCSWLEEDASALGLPDFPPLPRREGGAAFSLPPIPMLLPAWQQLQSLAEKRHPELAQQPREQGGAGTRSVGAFALGGALGAGLGAVLVFVGSKGRCNLRR